MSSPYFGDLEFTLENPTSRWVRIEKIALDFGSDAANQLVSLPWGSQLARWAEATHQRNVIREINDEIALALIGGTIMVAAGTANAGMHGAVAGAAVGAMAGGLVAMNALARSPSASGTGAAGADAGPVFDGRHLLALPLDVPPGLFLKRYIVLNTPYAPELPCLTNVTMTYQLADGSMHRVALRFREALIGNSQWQANVCPRAEQ
jgi:hypothetical protein